MCGDRVAVMEHLSAGKVRDLYALPDGNLVLVASDRISAYDHVLSTEIPDKGRLLTAMSLWWFEELADLVPSHVVSSDLPADAPSEWAGRAIVCRQLSMVPVECVARGYLAGSALRDYERAGSTCGIELPPGLVEGSRLDAPLFTPATKAPLGGHDENIAFEAVAELVGDSVAAALRHLTLDVFRVADTLARERGIIVADTKLEFGHDDGGALLLADEVLTPDSSRFWPADGWLPGAPQPSYDKQFVRDWLDSPEAAWDRAADEPPPPLPARVVEQTRARYVEAYERLTGTIF